MALTISVRVQSPSLGGAANPAVISHSFLGAGVIQVLAAKAILYHRVVAQSVGVNSAIQQVSYRTHGPDGPNVDIPFPINEFGDEFQRLSSAYQAVVSATPAYGVFQLGEAIAQAAPRGTSLCMIESTETKSSAGRHFIPDISRTAFDPSSGDVIGVVRTLMAQAWQGAFLGQQIGMYEDASIDSAVGVWSRTTQTFTEATGARCSVLGSVLQSRKR